MIASRELLTNIKPLSPVVRIGVAESGRFVQAEEKGEICLRGEGGAQHKFQALHVPSFEKNLLSVSKLRLSWGHRLNALNLPTPKPSMSLHSGM
jgi:hypothetical protein